MTFIIILILQMTTLNEIANFLEIEIGDKRFKDGKKHKHKNRYYFYENQYYIVELTQGKYMICEDSKKTRQLLRLHCWRIRTDGYALTHFGNTTKSWHQLDLKYQKGLVADHLNNNRFDNRHKNLRITTPLGNSRNRTKHSNNVSGKQGVSFKSRKQGNKTYEYWYVQINNNDGKRISKRFSILEHGSDEAKRLAIEWRKQTEIKFDYLGD
jgi:hypothetical protein